MPSRAFVVLPVNPRQSWANNTTMSAADEQWDIVYRYYRRIGTLAQARAKGMTKAEYLAMTMREWERIAPELLAACRRELENRRRRPTRQCSRSDHGVAPKM